MALKRTPVTSKSSPAPRPKRPAPAPQAEPRVVLPGTERRALPPESTSLSAAGAPPPRSRIITVSVLVRRRTPIDTAAIAQPGTPRLSRAQFGREYGADPAAVKAVRAFARQFGLTVAATPEQLAARTLKLTGSRKQMEAAFGVSLSEQQHAGRTYRIREGSIHIPTTLSGLVEAVLGLDDRPQARPHFRIAHQLKVRKPNDARPAATSSSFTPPQIAALYDFPADASAAGQTIGLIELGGGYRTADLSAYFKSLGLAAPTVVAVPVDGGKNAPSTADGADGEVMLDIEVAASVAPGAKIAVYFAPNTDQGFVDAVTTALHDTTNKPSVLSISWGGPESSWTEQAINALDNACQAAAILGVTITVAAGDNGSTDGVDDGANHVDFPASSPHVLACGGTRISASGPRLTGEVVWNELSGNDGATGGGVSNVFPLPTWQSKANVPAPTVSAGGRGVPDVAGNADPVSGYTIRVDGQTLVIGGTSAVAPLWAGLIAVANASNRSSAGFLNPTLYADPSAFHDITDGNNGGFQAAAGWDPCTGLGSPIGTAVVSGLGAPSTGSTGKGGKKGGSKGGSKSGSKGGKKGSGEGSKGGGGGGA